MRTRRTNLLPPSILAKKVIDYATHGKHAGAFGNAWLESRGDKIYVRGYKRTKLELATWDFNRRGKGHATALLTYLETMLSTGNLPQTQLFVESVHNQRFAEYFRRRTGWVEISGLSFAYAVA